MHRRFKTFLPIFIKFRGVNILLAFVVIINHTKTANCKDNNQTAQAPVEIEKLMELRTKNITKLLEKKTSLHRLKKNKTSNQHETQQTEKIFLQEINTLKNEIIKIVKGNIVFIVEENKNNIK